MAIVCEGDRSAWWTGDKHGEENKEWENHTGRTCWEYMLQSLIYQGWVTSPKNHLEDNTYATVVVYLCFSDVITECINIKCVCSVFQVPLLLVVVLLKIWNQCIYRESLAPVQSLLCSIVSLLPLQTQHALRDQLQMLFAKMHKNRSYFGNFLIYTISSVHL